MFSLLPHQLKRSRVDFIFIIIGNSLGGGGGGGSWVSLGGGGKLSCLGGKLPGKLPLRPPSLDDTLIAVTPQHIWKVKDCT